MLVYVLLMSCILVIFQEKKRPYGIINSSRLGLSRVEEYTWNTLGRYWPKCTQMLEVFYVYNIQNGSQ